MLAMTYKTGEQGVNYTTSTSVHVSYLNETNNRILLHKGCITLSITTEIQNTHKQCLTEEI